MNVQPDRVLVWISVVTILAGCSHRQAADEELNESLSRMGVSRAAVLPLAGKVTIDGHPPHLENRRQKILVVLNDPTKPDVVPLSRPYVTCNPQGEFAFRTYGDDDGVPPGNYVVTFALLNDAGKRGYLGPDGFKNLYSDPEKSEFRIAHQGSGRTDYEFDVKIEGRDPIAPGPRALQGLGQMNDVR
jgi:hypothetical protein